MSDDDNTDPDDKELEDLLRRQIPIGLKKTFVDELARDQQRMSDSLPAKRQFPIGLVATLLACTVVFCGTIVFEIRRSAPSNEITKAAKPAPLLNRSQFVPVSSEGLFINASSDGIIQSGDQYVQQFQLNYQDVDHWQDPETKTHIRIYSPRKEVITVPIRTD